MPHDDFKSIFEWRFFAEWLGWRRCLWLAIQISRDGLNFVLFGLHFGFAQRLKPVNMASIFTVGLHKSEQTEGRQPMTQHKFNPWRIKGDQRIVAAESTWKKVGRWERQAHNRQTWYSAYSAIDADRPRVMVGADVFEDRGRLVYSRNGYAMFQCCQCQFVWSANMDGYDPAAEDTRIICSKCKSVGPNEMTISDVRRRLFELIDDTPHLDWYITTAFPENVHRMAPGIVGVRDLGGGDGQTITLVPRPNLWINGKKWDEFITNGGNQ